MIREICRCPYCGEGQIAVDDDLPEIVFDADRPAGSPCPHLAFAWVGLPAFEGADDENRDCEDRSGFWLWAFGQGLRRWRPENPQDLLDEYLPQLCCDLLPAEMIPKGTPFIISGGTAGEREEQQPGSGEFSLSGRREGEPLMAILDGWGIYAQDPAALAILVRGLVSA